jgi:hypothetical protein
MGSSLGRKERVTPVSQGPIGYGVREYSR